MKDDRCLIKGLWTVKNGGQMPNKKSFRTRDGLWQVLVVDYKIDTLLRINWTEVRQWPSKDAKDSW